jgi:hypothetical protein
MKFRENPSSGSRVVPCGRKDKTDVMTLVVAFCKFCEKRLKKSIEADPRHLVHYVSGLCCCGVDVFTAPSVCIRPAIVFMRNV